MDRNDTFHCDKCQSNYHRIEDLAKHVADHLVISVTPFIQLCPICDTENENLEDLLDHVLDHLISSPLQQAKLVRWISQQIKSDHFTSKKRSDASSRKTQKFTIILPTIGLHNKCLFCGIFLSPDPKMTKKVLEHIFSHLVSSSHRIQRAALWAEKFFKSKLIVKPFHNFLEKTTLDRSSNLLEKLPVFENEVTNTCRLCRMKFSNASDLYAHYAEWHTENPIKYFNCVLCNFKDSNEGIFIEHIYKRHVGCACREKYPCFKECLKHVRGCWKNCPHCRSKLVDSKGLTIHEKCPFCGETMKSDRLKSHLSSCCPSMATVGVRCPTCWKFAFVEKDKLDHHLLYECQPWIANSNEEVPCLNGNRKNSEIPEMNNLVELDDFQIVIEPIVL